jgi:translation initiation factor IF-1
VDVIAVRDPKMRKFIRTLKPGDVVEVTYTESLAVDVTPVS